MALSPSDTPADLPACPDWKTPKSQHNKQELATFKKTAMDQALPSSVHRLAWLKDRDAQLNQLLDYLQSIGIPMGSETWALRTLLKIRRLKAESDAAWRVLGSLNNNELPDLERMRLDFEHAKAMHAKFLPPRETHCDWCGWPGARLIGEGNAACEDCLPTAGTAANKPATTTENMSVHLTAKNLKDDDEAEVINISNGEWRAILAFAEAFGIEIRQTASHDMKFYEPGDLREIADRIEQVKHAPNWLRYLADNGGAISS